MPMDTLSCVTCGIAYPIRVLDHQATTLRCPRCGGTLGNSRARRRVKLPAAPGPIPDVLGPINAGMQAAWINRNGMRRPRRTPPPTYRLRSLSELVPLLVPS